VRLNRRRFAALLTAVMASGAVHAQQQQPPVFRSGVQIVEVDVRVFDRDGRFIEDLTAADFEVLEDGVPQPVQSLFLVGGRGEAGGANLPTQPTAPTRTHVPTTPRQTWIFFFDLNHLTPGSGFDRARRAVEDFIRDRFRDGDLAGVVAGERMVDNRLTSVREELLKAVAGVKPLTEARSRQIDLTRGVPRFLDEAEAMRAARGDREAVGGAAIRACSDDPSICEHAESMVREKGARIGADIRRTTMASLRTINALAAGLARIPGPKTIVLLSDGFVTEQVETTLRSVAGQTARAGARIYAIDVRGLNRGRGAGLIDQEQVADEAGGPPSFDELADAPNSLAVDTGGLMIRNENNIGRALDTIVDDASRYYVLAYQAPPHAYDGSFRPIQVRVNRAGVRVRARRGYLALEPSTMLRPQPIKPPGK